MPSSLADQIGYRWNPFDARRRQESLDQARAALGDEQLQQAYAHGMALSFDQVIELALGSPAGHATGCPEPLNRQLTTTYQHTYREAGKVTNAATTAE